MAELVKNPNWDRYKNKWNSEITVRKYLEGEIIVKSDVDLIERYISHRVSTRKRLSQVKIDQTKKVLVYWRRYIKVPYEDVEIEDVHRGINSYKNAKTRFGTPYKQNTQHDMISTLKSFLRFLSKKGYTKSAISMDDIAEIETPSVNHNTTKANELYTEDELAKIISMTSNLMQKAFIAMCYESGARPEEVASLTWDDLSDDQYGIRAFVPDFKSGDRRFARLTMSAPYLGEWKKHHGFQPQSENFIFIGRGRTPISYSAAQVLMYRAVKRAGINKGVKMYLLRKTRITDMYRQGINASAIRETIWGNQSTGMEKVYVKLSSSDVDKMLLEAQGIEIDHSQEERTLKNITCHNCHTQNAFDSEYCKRCGTPIGKNAVTEYKSADKQIEESELYKSIYAKLKADMGLK